MNLPTKFCYLLLCLFVYNVILSQDTCKEGLTFYEEEKYTNAISSLNECLRTNPNNEEANYKLGRSYASLEDWEKAAKVYEKLVSNYPENADYNFLYGGSLGLYAKELSPFKSVNYLSDIKFYLKKAIKLDPKHIEARWALVQIYMELPFIVGGSKSTAEDYANQLAKISPVDGYLAFGFIEAYEENWSDAEVEYKKAAEIGQSETTFKKLVEVQLKQGKINEAKKTLLEAYQVTGLSFFKQELDKLQ